MQHLTKEMIQSKKNTLILELENMENEKCPLKTRGDIVKKFLSEIKEILYSHFINYHGLNHLSFKQIANVINNVYETDITEDELKEHINDTKYLSREESMVVTHKIHKKLQILIEDINNIIFLNGQIKKNKKRRLPEWGINFTWKRNRGLKYIKSSPR